jgi:hypothetical protein
MSRGEKDFFILSEGGEKGETGTRQVGGVTWVERVEAGGLFARLHQRTVGAVHGHGALISGFHRDTTDLANGGLGKTLARECGLNHTSPRTGKSPTKCESWWPPLVRARRVRLPGRMCCNMSGFRKTDIVDCESRRIQVGSMVV